MLNNRTVAKLESAAPNAANVGAAPSISTSAAARSREPLPIPEVVALLRKLVEQTEKQESDQPILKGWEFDLATGQSARVYVDTDFSRWVIWSRNTTGGASGADYLRLAVAESVPGSGANGPSNGIDLSSGKVCIIPAAGRMLSITNPGTATLHINIIADGGGNFGVY